jgi:hypothetical protein
MEEAITQYQTQFSAQAVGSVLLAVLLVQSL